MPQTLHPTQHRVLTVREYARAQGFPDTFTWDPEDQKPADMYRQIGNAVAVPVGCALGKELLKVMIRQWEKEGCPTAGGRQEQSAQSASTHTMRNDDDHAARDDDVEILDVSDVIPETRRRRQFQAFVTSDDEDLMDVE